MKPNSPFLQEPHWQNRYRQEMAKRGIPIRTTALQRERLAETVMSHTAAAVIQPSAYVRAQAMRRAWIGIISVVALGALAIWGLTL